MSARVRNSYARLSSDVAKALRVPEHPELGDVAAEEERRRPVGDDAKLPREERKLVQVVRPRDEPAWKAAQPHAEDVGDPFVAAERRHLTQRADAVAVGEEDVVRPGLLERRGDADVDAAAGKLAGRVVAEAPRDLGEDLR